MRNFVYIIGTTDEFESLEDLKNAYFDGVLGDYNASVYHIKLPTDAGTDALPIVHLATLVGQGMAFGNDWCMDGTFSDLLEA
jgi:hypothetical protein